MTRNEISLEWILMERKIDSVEEREDFWSKQTSQFRIQEVERLRLKWMHENGIDIFNPEKIKVDRSKVKIIKLFEK